MPGQGQPRPGRLDAQILEMEFTLMTTTAVTSTAHVRVPRRARGLRPVLLALVALVATALTMLVGATTASAAPAPINLNSASCPANMQQGEVDGCVTELQNLLNNNGAGLGVDGNFGPGTFTAVKNYQSAHGLVADGIVGPNTKTSLYGGSGTGNATIVNYATAIKNGQAEPGWGGGAVPYSWGGGHSGGVGPSLGTCVGYTGSIQPCPADTTVGVDCSGFSRWVYSLAFGSDVLGPGNTDSQIAELPATSNPVPGDLVFFGTSRTNTHHVGIYIGNGQMIDALHTGSNVETDPVSAGGTIAGYSHLG
jgi:peptidoglycan hydrolase-like protein with peptidoglycan-binding domain